MARPSTKAHSSAGEKATPSVFRRLWPEFAAPSWSAWNAIEDAIFSLDVCDPAPVYRVTGRTALPTQPVAEFWGIVGRGGGKSRFVARLAVYFGCGRSYRRVPGEHIYVGVFAPDRKQSTITFRYIAGLLRAVPQLESLIVGETKESIELSTGVIIEVITANTAAPRGRAYALAIIEEAAFLPADDAADPDRELLRAVRPALARVPGSLLAVISSPYARRGELWRVHREHYGKESNSILVVQADTRTLNPTFSETEIERAYAEDEAAARAEYGAQFRSDVESFIPRESIDACVVPDRRELSAVAGVRYQKFLDFAGGSGTDSATLAIAHKTRDAKSGRDSFILDLVREVRPPFSPEQVCEEFATVIKAYGGGPAIADRFAGLFPVEQMRRYGVEVKPSEKSKSEIYREFLPLLNSGRVELLEVPRLTAQIAGLERRVARGGRDSIDHAPGGHDDLANAAAGALVESGMRRAHGGTWGPRRAHLGTGVSYVRAPNGERIASHPEGDEYAAKILSGEIPLEVARENQRKREREHQQFLNALTTRKPIT